MSNDSCSTLLTPIANYITEAEKTGDLDPKFFSYLLDFEESVSETNYMRVLNYISGIDNG